MWMQKNRKTIAQDVFDRRWSLDGGKDTDRNISARSLTLMTFAVAWALCGRQQPEHDQCLVSSAYGALQVCLWYDMICHCCHFLH